MSSKPDPKATLYCSFCGKSQHDVRKLIGGPKVLICDECVVLCMDILTEEETKAGSSYGKFLTYFKKPESSLEKFNKFFGTKSPAEKTEEVSKKIVEKCDQIIEHLNAMHKKTGE